MAEDEYYSLVPEQGLCLVGDVIINLRKAAVIRKVGGKTQIFYPGSAQPVELPGDVFDHVREEVFAMESLDDDDDFEDDEDMDEEEEE